MAHGLEDDESDFYGSGNVRDIEEGGGGDGPGVGHNSGETEVEALLQLEEADLARTLRKTVWANLLSLIQTGMATPADYANALRMLKDNGYTLGDPEGGASGVPKEDKEGKKADLPKFPKPDYED